MEESEMDGTSCAKVMENLTRVAPKGNKVAPSY